MKIGFKYNVVTMRVLLVSLFIGFFGISISQAVAKDCPSAEKSFKEYKSELQKCMNERGYDLNDNDLKKLTNKKVSLKFYTETNEEISKDDEAVKNNTAKSSDIVFENKNYSDISAVTNKFSKNIYAIHKSLQKEINLFNTNKLALPVDKATLTENLFAGFEQSIAPPKKELPDSADEVLTESVTESAITTSGNTGLLIGGGVAVGAFALGGGGGGGGGCSAEAITLTSTNQVTEGGTATITATLAAPSTRNLTINLTVSGPTDDYSHPSPISIPIGSSSGTSSLVTVDDAIYEGDETKTISSQGGCTNSTSLVIAENEQAPRVSFTLSQTSLAENASLSTEQIIITATTDQIADEDMTVYFLSNGEGALRNDYFVNDGSSVIIPALSSTGAGNISPIDDEIYEGDETTSLYINFIEGADAQQGSPSRKSFTITEDDPLPNLTISGASSSLSGTKREDSADSLTLNVSTDRLASSPIVVVFTANGAGDYAATIGADFTVSNATILAGETSGTATVSLIDDNVYDGSIAETATIVMSSASPGNIDSSSQEIRISDNDAAPTITLSTSTNSFDEKTGVATLTVTASRASDFPVNVSLRTSGTANNGTDYSVSNNVTINALSLTGTTPLKPINDTIYESPAETAVVDINSVDGDGAAEDGDQQVTINITEFALNAGVQLSYDETSAETRRSSDEFDNFNGVGAASVQNPLEVINAHKAHGYGLDGAGETIMVVDSCHNSFHPDMQDPIITLYGVVDTCNGAGYHGATVAGVIAADESNDDTLVGVAPGVDLVHAGYNNRTNSVGADSTFYAEKWAQATKFAKDNNHIAQNNSWGPSDTPITTIQSNINNNSSTPQAEVADDWTSGLFGPSASDLGGEAVANYVSELDDYQEVGVVVFALSNTAGLNDADTIAALPVLFPELEEAWITAVNIEILGSVGNETYSRKSAPCGQTAEYCIGADGWEIAGLANNAFFVGSTSGTSFVAPMISGALAILAQAFPNHTPEQLVDRILASGDNTWFTPDGNTVFANGVTHGYSTEFGHGIMDIYAALQPITLDSNVRLSVYSGQQNIRENGDSISSTTISPTRSFGDSLAIALKGENNYFYDAMDGGFAYDVSSHIRQSGLNAKTINVYSAVNNLKTLELDNNLEDESKFSHVKIGDRTELVKLSLTKGQATLPAQNFLKNDNQLIKNFTQYDTPYLSRHNNSLGLNAYIETDKRSYFFGYNPKISDPENSDQLSVLNDLSFADTNPFNSEKNWMKSTNNSERPGAYEVMSNVADRESTALSFGFNQTINENDTLGFIAGIADEENGFLGLRGTGAFTLKGAKTETIFSGVNYSSKVSETFSLRASALFASSQMDNQSDTMFYGSEDVLSDSYSLIVEKTDIFGNDKLEFAISQPNRVSSGSMNIRLSNLADMDGNITYTNKKISLDPSGRQIDVAFAYAKQFSKDFVMSTKFTQTSNLNHIKSSEKEYSSFVGAKYKKFLFGAAHMPYEDEFIFSYSTQF
ncbi:MAG: hypothetical protein CML73_02835 [Rhodobiaceae bacterium]|nr:hypothetical protein [Rhodobiaceae bacterium]